MLENLKLQNGIYIYIAPTRNIFFKTDEQRTVCNNPLLAVDLGKAFHLLTENGKSRPTKSRPRVKGSGFNFARGSESTFETRFAQPYGFVGQQQKLLGNEREARVINKNK